MPLITWKGHLVCELNFHCGYLGLLLFLNTTGSKRLECTWCYRIFTDGQKRRKTTWEDARHPKISADQKHSEVPPQHIVSSKKQTHTPRKRRCWWRWCRHCENQMLVHQVKMTLLSDLGILLALCTHLQSSYSCYYQRVELALMSISG